MASHRDDEVSRVADVWRVSLLAIGFLLSW
jgi:hypothetical protein